MADLKQLARLIFQETLAAIDIPAVMQRKVRVEGAKLRCGKIALDLNAFSRIRVVAIGKAAHGKAVVRQLVTDDLAIVLVVFDEQDADGIRFEGQTD